MNCAIRPIAPTLTKTSKRPVGMLIAQAGITASSIPSPQKRASRFLRNKGNSIAPTKARNSTAVSQNTRLAQTDNTA